MDKRKLHVLWVVVAFFIGLIVGRVATGTYAHGDDTALIHACVKSNGNIRIVTANAGCGNNETPLDWRIQGDPGLSGPASTVLCPACTLPDTNLTNANLPGAFLEGSEMSGTNLTDANLVNANLTNTNLVNANLTGANLTGANLTGATLTGVIWSNTICPDSTNSDANGNTCIGHLTP